MGISPRDFWDQKRTFDKWNLWLPLHWSKKYINIPKHGNWFGRVYRLFWGVYYQCSFHYTPTWLFVVSSAGTSCHDTVDKSKILRTKFWLIGDSWSVDPTKNPKNPLTDFQKIPIIFRVVRSLRVFQRKSPTWKKVLFGQPSTHHPEFCQRRLGLHQRYPARREYDRSSRYNLAGSVALIPKDIF